MGDVLGSLNLTDLTSNLDIANLTNVLDLGNLVGGAGTNTTNVVATIVTNLSQAIRGILGIEQQGAEDFYYEFECTVGDP